MSKEETTKKVEAKAEAKTTKPIQAKAEPQAKPKPKANPQPPKWHRLPRLPIAPDLVDPPAPRRDRVQEAMDRLHGSGAEADAITRQMVRLANDEGTRPLGLRKAARSWLRENKLGQFIVA